MLDQDRDDDHSLGKAASEDDDYTDDDTDADANDEGMSSSLSSMSLSTMMHRAARFHRGPPVVVSV